MEQPNESLVGTAGSGVPGARHPRLRRWVIGLGLLTFIGTLVVVAGIFLSLRQKHRAAFSPAGEPEFHQAFPLVSEQVSQSATIRINLPPTADVVDPDQAVRFTPAIAGTWVATENARQLAFRPNEKLKVGRYYAVTVSADGQDLSQDFRVVEDPKVEAIFPAADTETPEFTSVTIFFSRPMVPLTTLDTVKTASLPVSLTPATAGKWKWITTRNLQFIPEKRLQRSSRYTVALNEGLISVEGLPVAPAVQSFTTRPLRYEFAHTGKTLYREPIRITFNQPVDLERTRAELALMDGSGRRIDFTLRFGRRSVVDPETQRKREVTDRSMLEIIQAADRHGRKDFWDFSTTYRYTLAKAYPAEGDLALEQSRQGEIQVTEIIEQLSAESPRSKHVELNLFDPEGKLWVKFYEPIDLAESLISAPSLISAAYAKRCKAGLEYASEEECEKEDDHQRIALTFTPAGLPLGEIFPIRFAKVVNAEGLQLNGETVTKNIRVYPKLKVTKTVPGNGVNGALLTKLVLCTTNPLNVPDEKEFYLRVVSEPGVGLWRWNDPHRILLYDTSSPCAVGDFENTISYGLTPQSPYRIRLHVLDDFGQTVDRELSFTSGQVPEYSRNFYHLQKQYNVTAPDRTKLTYAVENLEYVTFDLCQVTPETMLRYLDERPGITAGPGSLTCTRRTSRRIDLPQRYWTKNYFQVNLRDEAPDALGHYVLTFSHPEYRRQWSDAHEQIFERTYLTVTQLAVQEKKVEWNQDAQSTAQPDAQTLQSALSGDVKNLYWVSQFSTLDPAAGASVELFQDDYTRRGTFRTDANGVARTPVIPNLLGAIVTHGHDSAIVTADTDKLQWVTPASAATRSYLYTDRPIYRPGQEVFIKGLYRIGYDANYHIPKQYRAEVKVFNSADEIVHTKELPFSPYGTFSTNLTLDAKAPLGTYRIEALGGVSYFDVEEYVPAAFKVETQADQEEYIAGQAMRVNVSAAYYFGVPLEGGEVEYSLAAQNYYFDRYQDEYFRFGQDWYYDYDGGYGDTFLLRGHTTLDKNGRATINRELDFEKFFKPDQAEQSKIFILYVTVKNRNGQSVSTQQSVIVHRGEWYLGVDLEPAFLGVGEPAGLRLKTVDTQGKPVGVGNLSVKLHRVTWEYFQRREVDGRYYYRSERKLQLVRQFAAATGQDGNFSQSIAVDHEGEFEVEASGRDQLGNRVVTRQDLYVYGPRQVDVRPTNNETLDLATDKKQLNVGDVATVVIKSPYPKAKALIGLERGKLFSYEVVDVTGNLYAYRFTVKPEHIPNVFATVLLLSPRPEMKYGQINYLVNTDRVTLNVEVKANKTHYLPGEEVELEVHTTDWQGKPASAEVSVAVADLSVLALKGNPKKNPLVFFYDGNPLAVMTSSNVKNILYEAEIPTGTKGGGGAEPEDLAKKRRGVFKDTAYWKADVVTNAAGFARLTFTLPDNLTTWQVEGLGITTDTLLGVDYAEFLARKDIMVVPRRPRFVIPGDAFAIGATIFNQTDAPQRLSVTVTSTTLKFVSDATANLVVPARSEQPFFVRVVAPPQLENGSHAFTITAKNADFEDTVENVIPITRNDTYEAVATAYSTTAGEAKEYVYLPDNIVADKGVVSVQASATLAVFLSDALKSLAEYPYGCSEQIVSKLSAMAIVQRGLQLKNVADKFSLPPIEFEGRQFTVDEAIEAGLNRLYASQTGSGGFAYYPSMSASFPLTLHVINALVDVQGAGYAVRAGAIDSALQYVWQQVTYSPEWFNDDDWVILAAYAMSRVPSYRAPNDTIEDRVRAIAKNEQTVNEKLSSLSLAHLAILLTRGYPAGLKSAVYKSLENRVQIDSRGAYLPPLANRYRYEYFETPVKNTAMLLKAIAADRRENVISDKVVRWLLRSRAKDGAWGSSNNTVTVVDAFTDWLAWRRETESEFDLGLWVDDKKLTTWNVGPQTVFDIFSEDLAISAFPRNTLNTLTFRKTNRSQLPNAFYYDLLLKYYLPTGSVPPRDEGFAVTRSLYRLDDRLQKTPVTDARPGEVLHGRLVITAPKTRNYVAVEDFIPAGTELVNFRLSTEDTMLERERGKPSDGYNTWDGDGSGETGPAFDWLTAEEFGMPAQYDQFRPDAEETHDDRLFLFKERLAPGVYAYDYFVRALIPGTYQHLPAVVSEMYFPENFGRTRGEYFTVRE